MISFAQSENACGRSERKALGGERCRDGIGTQGRDLSSARPVFAFCSRSLVFLCSEPGRSRTSLQAPSGTGQHSLCVLLRVWLLGLQHGSQLRICRNVNHQKQQTSVFLNTGGLHWLPVELLSELAAALWCRSRGSCEDLRIICQFSSAVVFKACCLDQQQPHQELVRSAKSDIHCPLGPTESAALRREQQTLLTSSPMCLSPLEFETLDPGQPAPHRGRACIGALALSSKMSSRWAGGSSGFPMERFTEGSGSGKHSAGYGCRKQVKEVQKPETRATVTSCQNPGTGDRRVLSSLLQR